MAAAASFRWVLPVSGREVTLRHPTGRDEFLLLERGVSEVGCAIAFADALACDPIDAATLPVPDLDALLLQLRRKLIGDRLLAETQCGGCGARVDIAFSVAAYLAHHRPRAPRRRCLPCAEQPGWFELSGGGAETVRFRIPSAADESLAAGAVEVLARRCVAPWPCAPASRRAAEAAMAALAPALAGPLAGVCPHCGDVIAADFDPRRAVLAELRARARFVAEDVDALARHYHWSERAILTLPSPRRAAYADMARRAA